MQVFFPNYATIVQQSYLRIRKVSSYELFMLRSIATVLSFTLTWWIGTRWIRFCINIIMYWTILTTCIFMLSCIATLHVFICYMLIVSWVLHTFILSSHHLTWVFMSIFIQDLHCLHTLHKLVIVVTYTIIALHQQNGVSNVISTFICYNFITLFLVRKIFLHLVYSTG